MEKLNYFDVNTVLFICKQVSAGKISIYKIDENYQYDETKDKWAQN